MTFNINSLLFLTRIVAILLLGAAFVSGCAPKLSTPAVREFTNELNLNKSCLWKIVVNRGGEEKFSGILAIKQHVDFISLVLLDPTGITLLKGEVFQSGDISLTSSLEKIKKSKIEDYMGKVVFRIFYLMPSDETCRKGFSRLCWVGTDIASVNKKIYTFGPFLFWSISYKSDGKEEGHIKNIEFNHPWSKTTILLEGIK